MSFALPAPSLQRRGSQIGLVVGLHVVVVAALLTAKSMPPKVEEIPIAVQFIQMEAPKPVEKKPQPPQPQPKTKTPPTPRTPPLETTTSTVPTASAPVAPLPEPKAAPAAAAAPAEPAVTQARFDADYLRNPAPPYPPLSRRLGEEGRVILRVLVTPQGTAEQVEIKTSSGSARLDESARSTVLRSWKFVAAKRGDQPIQSWVQVPIIFKLEQ